MITFLRRGLRFLYWRGVWAKNYFFALGRWAKNYARHFVLLIYWRSIWAKNYISAGFRWLVNNSKRTYIVFTNFFRKSSMSLSPEKISFTKKQPHDSEMRSRIDSVPLISFQFLKESTKRSFSKGAEPRNSLVEIPSSSELSRELQPRRAIVIFHSYHLEYVEEILMQLNLQQRYFSRILITHSLNGDQLENLQTKILKVTHIPTSFFFSENKFRDVKPFIEALSLPECEEAEVFLKIHTKKSPHLAGNYGDFWRSDLIGSLVNPTASSIDGLMATLANSCEPIWAAPKQWIAAKKHWGSNGPWVWTICKQMGFEYFPKEVFPMGNMYWFNRAFANEIKMVPIPERIQRQEISWSDGTWAHAVERMVGQITSDHGGYVEL